MELEKHTEYIIEMKKIIDKYDMTVQYINSSDAHIEVDLYGKRMPKPNKDFLREINKLQASINTISNFHKGYRMSRKRQKKGIYNLKFDLVKSIEENKDLSIITDFIDKYEINSFDELVKQITLSVKDLNKYVKLNNISDTTKKDIYAKKYLIIKFLLNNGYIDRVTKHKISNLYFPLFWTNIKNEKSFGNYVSFHMTPSNAKKMNIHTRELEKEPDRGFNDVYNLIEDEEKMKLGYHVLKNIKTSEDLIQIKNNFNG